MNYEQKTAARKGKRSTFWRVNNLPSWFNYVYTFVIVSGNSFLFLSADG